MERDHVPLTIEKTKDAVHDVLMVRFWNEQVRNGIYDKVATWLEDIMNRSETRGGAPRREIGDERRRTRANSSTLNVASGADVGSDGLGTAPKESKGRRIMQRAASSASLLVPGVRRDRSGSESSSTGGGGAAFGRTASSSDGGALFKRAPSSASTSTGVSGDLGKGHAADRIDIVEEDHVQP